MKNTKHMKIMIVLAMLVFSLSSGITITAHAKVYFPSVRTTIKKGKTKNGKLKGLRKKQKKRKWKFKSSDTSVVTVKRIRKHEYKLTAIKDGYAVIRATQGKSVCYLLVKVGKGSTEINSTTREWADQSFMTAFPPYNGFDNSLDCLLYYRGKLVDIRNQKLYGEVLCELYPDIFAKFRDQYASRCKSTLAKVMMIQQFYRDIGMVYGYSESFADTLTRKQGVCIQYARFTFCLCCTIGVPAEVIGSEKWNHAWNQVYIDGRWLSIDFTTVNNSFICNDNGEVPDDAIIQTISSYDYGVDYPCGVYTNTVTRDSFVVTIEGKEVDLNQTAWSGKVNGDEKYINVSGGGKLYVK